MGGYLKLKDHLEQICVGGGDNVILERTESSEEGSWCVGCELGSSIGLQNTT